MPMDVKAFLSLPAAAIIAAAMLIHHPRARYGLPLIRTFFADRIDATVLVQKHGRETLR